MNGMNGILGPDIFSGHIHGYPKCMGIAIPHRMAITFGNGHGDSNVFLLRAQYSHGAIMAEGEGSVSWQIRVPEELDNKVEEACKSDFFTKSEFIRQAVREKLEKASDKVALSMAL